MKILLVEDSATLRHAMCQYIREAGHEPLVAQSGEAALQMLEDTPVDLIIMDVEMPGLDGFETTRLIREWLGGHWVPIIFLTGKNEDYSYREGIEAGGDDYLIKPISPVIIKAKIRAMARIAEMRDQLKQLNAELAVLSQLDSLTQILNRRTFNEQAEHEWLLAVRHQSPTSVLMIDVDHFKPYNDHYGHPAGDECLKRVTEAMKKCLHRPSDLLGRYGGEEFIALLPNTDSAGAERVGECINQSVRALALEHKNSPTASVVTVSVGGATCNYTTGHKLEDVIKSADRALYKVKNSGRDSCRVEDLASHRTLLIAARSANQLFRTAELLQEDCNIVTADSSDECLEIAENVHPDLIVLDADAAFHNDNYLCRQLAQRSATAMIPLLVLTDSDKPEQLLNASAPRPRTLAWLQKPFTKESLRAKVQILLG
ncbi:diguanylate cyclase domain-containing protein [Marinimicrobium sp. ABcell2]|uniref:diguanylate cyclase domain-containing protein n=1 Tax=Marinimicrobium sp. ABcell2 TaxID=3069751 RepID=UPI0027B551D4|nr:diguanylate cyclase [Marinimicrobium sp. ABcell2]MDQ2078439.1 diguanylate cyclase [Marinimicrobium sp. ABcell2]